MAPEHDHSATDLSASWSAGHASLVGTLAVGGGELSEEQRGGARALFGAGLDQQITDEPGLARRVLDPADDDRRLKEIVRARLFRSKCAPVKIGRYTVLDRLGQGGMGVVYTAYDDRLDRKIAIKVLRSKCAGDDGVGRARLAREAQAMARIAHPGIVTVHEVGEVDGGVFVAMEFVRGQSLDRWLRTPRPWREVLEVFLQAGRGLAAAHRAGLVHRDFKPQNVLVGPEGAVKVLDFGLARAIDEVETCEVTIPGGAAHKLLDARLTCTGALMGTPAYMSPEQHRGRPADARSDQFAFAVALFEGLHRRHPFDCSSLGDLIADVMSGTVHEPPDANRVPLRLRRVIQRAMHVDPARRYPSMSELLAELGRDPAIRRRRITARVALAVAALGASAALVQRVELSRRADACAATAAEFDAVWSDEARRRVRDAVLATGLSYAAVTAEKLMPWLDRQAEAWRAARTEACMRADVHDTWDSAALDRSLWCLDERRIDMQTLVAELAGADRTTVEKAVQEAAALEAIAPCLDEDQLRRQPLPPPERREAVRELAGELAHASTRGHEDALAAVTRAHTRAVALDWPPLAASAKQLEGELLAGKGDWVKAEKVYSDAYYTAARAGLWSAAANTAIHLAFTVGYTQKRVLEGRAWLGHAEVATTHADDPTGVLEAGRWSALNSMLKSVEGSQAEALAAGERSLAMFESSLGPGHPGTAMALNNLANTYSRAEDLPRARALFERAVALFEATLGGDHPSTATALHNLAHVHGKLGELTTALALSERALKIRERALGPGHPDVAANLSNLANLRHDAGEYAVALALQQRVLAIFEPLLGPGHPNVAWCLKSMARAHLAMGEHAEARALVDRALAIHEQTGTSEAPIVELLVLAGVEQAAGRSTRARALAERALAQDSAQGRVSMWGAELLVLLSRIALAERRPYDALALAERAMIYFAGRPGVQAGEPAARFQLAQALAAAGGDPGRGLAEAEQARDGYRGAGAGHAARIAEIDAWIAANYPGALH